MLRYRTRAPQFGQNVTTASTGEPQFGHAPEALPRVAPSAGSRAGPMAWREGLRDSRAEGIRVRRIPVEGTSAGTRDDFRGR